RGLGRVVGLEASQGGDRALEARVDRLQPKSGGPLEDDGEKPFLYDGLRNNDLVYPVTIEVDGEGGGLDFVERGPHDATGHLAGFLLERYVGTAHGRSRAPEVFPFHAHLEPVVLVDEGENPRRVLAVHVREHRPHGPEGLVYLDRLVLHELAVLPRHLLRLALGEELFPAEALRPHGLLVAVTLDVDGEEKFLDAVLEVPR